MYIPSHFEVSDSSTLFEFIGQHAFGQLVSTVAGRPFVTHMPFLLSADRQRLIGHVARQNPQHQAIAGQEVLVTLQGPHAYVSPDWYVAPGVPTWNYQAVHVYGRASVFDEPEALREVVDGLTSIYEAQRDSPWQPDYREGMLAAIVGIAIDITEVQGKFKLSQNRSAEDRERVAVALQEGGNEALAAAMRRHGAQPSG